jgi:hypothetical protein
VSGEPKVKLTTLWQRTSAAGNVYLSGFLGKARIIGFRGEPTEDGTPTWDLYLQNGDRDGQRQASTSPRQARQPARAKPDTPAGDGRPFDDPIPELA